MIRESDNAAATQLHRIVWSDGIRRVAERAGMKGFAPSPAWGSSQTTAADQARLFASLDRLAPPRHRRYARRLLRRIMPWQRWGVPAAAPPGYRVMFKGGWRRTSSGRLVSQAALLERGGRQLSVSVLTDGNPTHEYGVETIEGIVRRLLRD